MILFIIRRQPVTISLTVFSNLTKVTNYLLILFTYLLTVKQVFSYYQKLSGSPSLQALHLSGTPSLTTGTRPHSCHTPRQPSIYMKKIFFTFDASVWIWASDLLS